MKNIFAIGLVVVTLTACGASGPRYRKEAVEPTSNPVVYVYRVSSFVAGGYEAHIQIDDLPVRKLKNGGFFKVSLPPGQHSLKTVKHGFQDWGADEKALTFQVEQGQRFFIKYKVDGKLFPTGVTALPVAGYSTLKLHAVLAEVAEKELAELNESEQ